MKGYHTYLKFENFKDYGEYEVINVIVQLASILFWKKHYGPIKLYANDVHLDLIKEYGIEQEYDEVNIDLINSMPYFNKSSRYWSFSKIYLAKEIAKTESQFCIIDTDLWITQPDLLKEENDFNLFHEEIFDVKSFWNTYHDPTNWMHQEDVDRFDWSIWPMNCGIIQFRNRTKELIDYWYDEVVKVILLNKNPNGKKNKNNSAVFVEQRMLPVIAKKLGISYGSIKPNSYLTYLDTGLPLEELWHPKLDSSAESLKYHQYILHVWGLKRAFLNPYPRLEILNRVISHLKEFPEVEFKYQKLFKECYKIMEDSRQEIIDETKYDLNI
jgi:hypothetical protein